MECREGGSSSHTKPGCWGEDLDENGPCATESLYLGMQVITYSNHGSQSNGFIQMVGKGAGPTAHRGVRISFAPFLGHPKLWEPPAWIERQ